MQTNEIIEELIYLVDTYSSLENNIKAVEAFDSKPQQLPISDVYVTFCANKNEVSFFEDESEECCRRTKVAIKVSFFAPPNKPVQEIYSVAETLMDYLIVKYEGKMKSYEIGEISIDKDLKAFKLPCTMDFIYEKCPAYAQDGTALRPFADFFCKTHVNDETKHVSQEEKDYLLEPFVTGTYVGNGDPEHEIFLGFRPKFVTLFGSGTAALGIEEDKRVAYFGFALRNKSTKGVAITADGFTVTQGDHVVARSTYPMLNAYGQTYNYIALK